MDNKIYCTASYDDFHDIIGVITINKEDYEIARQNNIFHSIFSTKQEAVKEAKRLCHNGAFYVGEDMDRLYLVFCGEDDDGNDMEYLTTRKALSKTLEHNQENGIEWETVDAVLEDYLSDKEVGIKLQYWLANENAILQERNSEQLKKLRFFTQKKR